MSSLSSVFVKQYYLMFSKRFHRCKLNVRHKLQKETVRRLEIGVNTLVNKFHDVFVQTKMHKLNCMIIQLNGNW